MSTQAEFARAVGISAQAIGALVQRGTLAAKTSGKMIEVDVDWLLAYCENLRVQASGRTPSDKDGELLDERIRLTRAQATNEEIEVSERRGDLQPTARVIAEYGAMVVAFRSKVLSIPSKAAPLVKAAKNLVEATAILERLCREALEEIARHRSDSRSVGPDLESGSPATGIDGESVGGSKPVPKPRGQRRTGKISQR